MISIIYRLNRIKNIFIGLILISFGIFLFISLLSFHPEDPTFTLRTNNNQIHNIALKPGSYSAGFLLEIIGLTSWPLCLIITIWGMKMLFNNFINGLFFKFISLIFFILVNTLLFAIISPPSHWQFISLGGVIGFYLSEKIFPFLNSVIWPISLVLSLISFSFIVGLSIRDWSSFVSWMIKGLTRMKVYYLALITKIISLFIPKKIFKNLALKIEKLKDKQYDLKEDNSGNVEIKNNIHIIKKSGNKKIKNYQLPPINLLIDRSSHNQIKISDEELKKQNDVLIKTLLDFSVKGKTVGISAGPIITLHEFEPVAGTKASRIIGLAEDIARSMEAVSARISIISGKNALGIEIPNKKRQVIYLRELIESKEYQISRNSLPMILGKDISGKPVIADLAKMPHLLIAGTTGSGKSVAVNAMILSLLYKLSPDECKFIMIDPKMLELSVYDGIPHLLCPVVIEAKKAIIALKWAVTEMESRYRAMSSLGVRNITGYNERIAKAKATGEILTKKVQTGFDNETGEPIYNDIEIGNKKLPFLVIVVDEMADLMIVAGKDIEGLIQRLAQMARAAGIHIIMATQRPSVDVITGVIKANFPTRISFQVTSRIDSRTILSTQGAEQLLGQGDMLYMHSGSKISRAHGPFCSDKEVENIVNFIKSQGEPQYDEQITKFIETENEEDEDSSSSSSTNKLSNKKITNNIDSKNENDDLSLYDKAVAIVRKDKRASTSYIQRQLRIGYNRAASLIEEMEKNGVVSPPSITGKREIL